MMMKSRYYVCRVVYFTGKRLMLRTGMEKKEAHELYRVLYEGLDATKEYLRIESFPSRR